MCNKGYLITKKCIITHSNYFNSFSNTKFITLMMKLISFNKGFSSSTNSSQFFTLFFFILGLTTLLLVSSWPHSPNLSPFLVSWTWRGEEQNTNSSHDGEKFDINFKHKGTNKYTKLERIESKLVKARYSIKEASKVRNLTSTHQDKDYIPRGPIYRNANAFHRSYLEMEKMFKIFVYKEGEPPMFHNGPSKDIYSTEGLFIHEMEMGRNYYTNDPNEAFVYFLPFSVAMMVQYIYVPGTYDRTSIGLSINDYIQTISHKYPFWNQSLGHDHFMVSCHDWGPLASAYVDNLFNNSIRVLCNANASEGFNPSKDVSYPEVFLKTGELTDLLGGYRPSRRTILAFFAGHLHGHIRYLLLKEWKNKDQDVQVYDEIPADFSYHTKIKSSKFCLCPSGYEVASHRITEAIFAECVPVLISDNYVPPFSDVLNWKAFSVQIDVKDIPNIKKILMGISQRQYLKMLRRVQLVQRHFVPNDPPKRFDVFHMTIHSIWLRMLNIHIHDDNDDQ